jgi:hypothetical protein
MAGLGACGTFDHYLGKGGRANDQGSNDRRGGDNPQFIGFPHGFFFLLKWNGCCCIVFRLTSTGKRPYLYIQEQRGLLPSQCRFPFAFFADMAKGLRANLNPCLKSLVRQNSLADTADPA